MNTRDRSFSTPRRAAHVALDRHRPQGLSFPQIPPAGKWRVSNRAEALLGQGDIVAARILLEHTLAKGSARAAFILAETYDGRELRAWGTHGIRPDNEKARELYARAATAGIEHAKERIQTLSAELSAASR